MNRKGQGLKESEEDKAIIVRETLVLEIKLTDLTFGR